MPKKAKKKKNFQKFWKFLEVTVTWSNEQMVTLLEVMITSQVTITSQEVIVTSPINEQMVEATILVTLLFKNATICSLLLVTVTREKFLLLKVFSSDGH